MSQSKPLELTQEDELKVRMELHKRKHQASVFGTVPQSDENLRIQALADIFAEHKISQKQEYDELLEQAMKLREAIASHADCGIDRESSLDKTLSEFDKWREKL